MSSETQRHRHSRGAILLEFLGSMNLAITLLVVIAIASVIGTVLQQNQPYGDYVMKFGPFWFEVFKSLGLYDVYGSYWFVILLGFLLLSTTVCIWRNTPAILRDMRSYRLGVTEKSLRLFHHQRSWSSPQEGATAQAEVSELLQKRGYRLRAKAGEGGATLAAMKGQTSRVGYMLTHGAIVVICVGGLLDGNLPLKIAELRGEIQAETRSLPVSEIPPKSTLEADNSSFRGNVSIPEGSSADFVFLPLRDGYLLQKLPFTVALEDFRIEHYQSGMPKTYESDLLIIDEALDAPLRKTISVNHPFTYKGYSIYQSSFADGGSLMKMALQPLDGSGDKPLRLEGRIDEHIPLASSQGRLTIELTDFKAFNIFPTEEGDSSGKKFRNFGPSLTFKVRRPTGEALEYVNYMAPVEMGGRRFIVSGMRTSPAEPFRYLQIPVDPKGGTDRFLHMLALLADDERIDQVIRAQAESVSQLNEAKDPEFFHKITSSMKDLVTAFVHEGLDAMVQQTEQNFPEEKRADAIDSYIKVIQGTLGALYIELLDEEGYDTSNGIEQAEADYFDDMTNALSLLAPYGSPFLLRLESFEQVEASGLQITRAPGQAVVYLGFVMLMAGVFFMLYLHHRRLWVMIHPEGDGCRLLFAGSGHRPRSDFDQEFEQLGAALERLTSEKRTR